MPTAVLTGCDSGIGHAWAKLLLAEGMRVWALDINVGAKLKSLEGPSCRTARLDVSSPDSINEFKQTIGDEPIDLLLNIAGIMADPEKEDSLSTVNLTSMQKQFAINTFGPLLLTQALLPNLLAAEKPRRLGVISSRVGSITDNTSGGYYAYRASKCAVHCFFKSLAVELKDKDVVVFMLHPGFTNTNLNADIKNIPGVVEPDQAARGLWNTVRSKTLEDTGKFWHRDGQELPW